MNLPSIFTFNITNENKFFIFLGMAFITMIGLVGGFFFLAFEVYEIFGFDVGIIILFYFLFKVGNDYSFQLFSILFEKYKLH